MKIILINALAGSGKDTSAQYLVEKYGYIRLAFGDEIRKYAEIIDPLLGNTTFSQDTRLSEVLEYHNHNWDTVKRQYPEARRLLQRLGTELFRDQISKFYWVATITNKINDICRGLEPEDWPSFVVPDWRFANEYDVVLDHCGYSDIHRLYILNSRVKELPGNHASESQTLDYDYTIDNSGALEELYKKLDELMESIN